MAFLGINNIGDALLGAATGGTSLAYNMGTGRSATNDLTGGVTKMLGIGGGQSTAGQYKKSLQADQAARQAAANDPNKGFSPFKDQKNEYVQRYGATPEAWQGILADTSQNAYQPLQNQVQAFANQPGVQANVDPAFRQYQMGLAQQLQQQAMGQGPSVAQMQLQQATDQSLNSSLAAIRAQGGPNGALNARTAALAGSQQLGQMGQNSAILRLQEQQQAQQALAGLANQGRQGDLNNAQLGANTALASRGQQLDALGIQRGVIGDRISGTTDVYRGALGIDAAGQEAKRQDDRAATARRQKQQDGLLGAGVNVLSTGLGSLFGD